MKNKIRCILLALVLIIFAINVKGQQSLAMKIDLSGKWLFSRDEAKVGVTEKWFNGKLKTPGTGPSEIVLPGTTDEAKAGIPNPEKPNLDGLYRPDIYTGAAWYQREIDIPDSWKGKHISLFLERNHWVTHVWIDGKDFGTKDNLISPQTYDMGIDIKPGKHRLTICVDNTLKFDLGRFVSINYEGTQTNWNGIIGKIQLTAVDPVSLCKIEVYPDVDHKLIKVKAYVSNLTGSPVRGNIGLSVVDAKGLEAGKFVSSPFSSQNQEFMITMDFPMGKNPKLWDEFSPYLYELKTSLSTKTPGFHDEKVVSFGMRKLAIQGTQFTMNGRPLMLRGTLECAIFPRTGYPPTDVASWRRIFKIEKSYGLNFIRFHSWTPPDAAFTAADQEGIMIQTEGPQANVQVGKDPGRDKFVEQELLGIIHTYGNHPSFCLMTIGNEYGGSNEILTHWVDTLIKSDPRHLYSSASSGQVTENRQWTETGKGRGIHGPNTMHNAEIAITEQDIPRPVIGHEIGQWTFFPDFHEIKKYTGVLKAANFEIVRNDLKKKGMLDEADKFFESTGHEAVLLYKEEIENLLRTPGYAGFSLLDLHDYPGQGTALIGLLDPFWDSKGFIKPEDHKKYCGASVPLLLFPKRTYSVGETFSAKAEITCFGADGMRGAQPEWTIRGKNGQILTNGTLNTLDLKTGTLTELGEINAPLINITSPEKLTVTLSLKNTSISNSWEIWVYPPAAQVLVPNNIIVSHTWDATTRAALAEGKRVVLLPDTLNATESLPGSFLPVFWSPIWFHSIPNTMGILCDPKSPLFTWFPTDSYSNWQWWHLIQGSKTMILNGTPEGFRPLVQVIDNFARNDKLANVFETKVGKGSLLVCSLNLSDEKLPETDAFLKSLYDYAASGSFNPSRKLDVAVLNKILSPSPAAAK